jgi:LDH2 family malate/lactate/ureidoglycolate dehydrogenase
MLPGLVQGIRDGRIRPDPELKLIKDRAAICVLDGGFGPGRFVSMEAMRQAIDRSRNYGLGACLALHTSHWGRAHAYACRAATQGVIGICTTNAITNMVGFGSSELLLGNNPLAIGIPARAADEPLVFDMAMSQAALGKVATWRREGKKVPYGWGLNDAGQPTDNPSEIMASGKLLPLGEHKGAGLSLMMEILTAALGGGLFSFELIMRDASGLDTGASKMFLALDPEAFIGREKLLQRTEALLAWIRAHAGTAENLLLPGERGWATRIRYLEEGIPIHPDIAVKLESFGIPLPWS